MNVSQIRAYSYTKLPEIEMNVSQIRAYSYTKLPGELVKKKASHQQRNASFQRNCS